MTADVDFYVDLAREADGPVVELAIGAYAEIESEERWQAIAATEVCRRWWRHMKEVMPASPDESPVSRDLREVFHIEGRAE